MPVVAQEIERRWLLTAEALKNSGWLQFSCPKKISQGYFTQPGAPVAVRVRLATEGAINSAEITFKGAPAEGKEGVAEANVAIPYAVGVGLKALTIASLAKTRHTVPAEENLVWEVDTFSGDLKGLLVVEIEVPYLSFPIAVPDFFGPEITGIKELSNVSCAFNPGRAMAKVSELLYPQFPN